MKQEASHQILVVDDEPQVRNLIATVLRNEGYNIQTAECGEQACKMLSDDTFDLVFTDLRMPQGTGIDVLKHIRKKNLSAFGVVVTGYGTFESAIEALRMGAFDFLTKPLHLEEIKTLTRRALDARKARSHSPNPDSAQVAHPTRIKSLIGESDVMQSLNRIIGMVAPSSSTVLIRGESGTGKELVAKALHSLSARSNRPLIPVNCGAIPEDLLESELFGHVKGSFTGATNDRIGRFMLANGGTIFLDEIGDMSPKLQVKLLRAIQEQEIEPVGSAETVKVDVRILAATNVDLERAVEEKRFREDLYYRLNVIPITVPPLRERKQDVPLLIQHFIKCFNQKQPRRLDGFSKEALEALICYHWPGNVRELENLVERMTILSQSSNVSLNDLPEKFHGSSARTPVSVVSSISIPQTTRLPLQEDGINPAERAAMFSANMEDEGLSAILADMQEATSAVFIPGGGDSNESLSDLIDRFEREMILKALHQSNGVKNRAAQLLGIKRTTLVEKMKKKNILFKRV